MNKLFTFLLSISLFAAAYSADITATQSGNWSDAATWTGGVVPAAGTNVFTNNLVIIVDVDATCDNLTFGDATTTTANTITISAGKTLTVRGSINCAVTSNVDVFGASDATSTLKLTGEAISGDGPYYMITDFAVRCVRPKNLVVEVAPADVKTYTIGLNQPNTFNLSAGKFTVKSPSKLTILSRMNIGKIDVTNLFTIESGAEVTTKIIEGDFTGVKVPAAKMVVNGTLITTDRTTVREFVLGENGIFKTTSGTNVTAPFSSWDGWWNSVNTTDPVGYGQYATPTSIAFGSNSTVEFNKTTAQNILGIVPENKVYTTSGVYYSVDPVPAFTIPYANLKLSGESVKTVQSNLIVKKGIEVVAGSMLIPAGKVVVNLGSFAGTQPTVTGALVNATANDNAKGTLTGTISATNEVSLVATPKPGYKFINWTEAPGGEISTSATLAAFTPADGITRTLVANFDISTGLLTNKVTPFVTIEGRNLKLNGEVSDIKLYNTQGSLIQSHTNVTSVNVLNSGIYIVRMHSAQGINVQKVVVK